MDEKAPKQDKPATDFIRRIIAEHNASGRFGGRVHTRFPPEPNGYLHIGHAKSALLNFHLARQYGGRFNLRFDDTNPAREEPEYVEAIKEDLRWLGCDWEGREFYASDYFEKLYEFAVRLVRKGKAYVDSLSAEEISAYRGTAIATAPATEGKVETRPGRNSPYRDRTPEESLDLLDRMRAGEFAEAEHVLRAKIDMAHPNLNLRDPILYRIRKIAHHRTGERWNIYPTYDWAHGQSDSIEKITHSICTLEFEDHRPLYDWFLDELGIDHPQQIEFAPLTLTHTVLSKRRLITLVREKRVRGWDDPRLPTLAGLRRRGFPPEAIAAFCRQIGVTKTPATVEITMLENAVREHLNATAPRALAVLRPLKVVIENYPEGEAEEVELPNHPRDASLGTRRVPFSRTLYIEQDDFSEDPPPKFFRLAPGREVRLRGAYFITCTEAVKDAEGRVVELRCTYDPATRGGDAPDGRRVKGTLHWVSAEDAVEAEVRLYDHLFATADPDEGAPERDWLANLNPHSLEVLGGCKLEPSLADAQPGTRYQFERQGYFCVDPDSGPGAPVFNRTVSLRDSWAREKKKG